MLDPGEPGHACLRLGDVRGRLQPAPKFAPVKLANPRLRGNALLADVISISL